MQFCQMSVAAEQSVSTLDQRLQKTKICKYFKNGFCNLGSKCDFAHSDDELTEKPSFKFLKTVLCKKLKRGKECNFAGGCWYAHSNEERVDNIAVMRNVLCPAMQSSGVCKHAEKCRFSHDFGKISYCPKTSPKPTMKPLNTTSWTSANDGASTVCPSEFSTPLGTFSPISTRNVPSTPYRPSFSVAECDGLDEFTSMFKNLVKQEAELAEVVSSPTDSESFFAFDRTLYSTPEVRPETDRMEDDGSVPAWY